MQLLAAEQLFERNWKFHKEEKIWISRTRNIEVDIFAQKNFDFKKSFLASCKVSKLRRRYIYGLGR